MRGERLLYAAVIVLTIGLLATIGLVVFVGTGALDSAARAADSATSAAQHANAATAASAAQQARLHTQLVQGCERLNVQRATSNSANAAEYTIDKIFFSAVRAQRPGKRQDAAHRRLIGRFVAAERAALRAFTWTPLTDCVAAVAISGSAYNAPAPVSFTKRQPPRSALDAVNAATAVPAGSIA